MAYRRSTRRSTRSRRRRTTRRTTRTRRSTRTNRVRSTRRLTRRIANVASVKKQDNMSNWVPTSSVNPGGAGQFGVQAINPATGPISFLFCPTAREFDPDRSELDVRNAQTIYARGYKEQTDIRMTGPQPFRWRRICFSGKGVPDKFLASDPTFVKEYYTLLVSPAGYVRQSNVLPSGAFGIVNSLLFKGTINNDWVTPMNAKPDTDRFVIHSDVTHVLNPGNQAGLFKVYNNYYPMNKNLTYGDDEAGTSLSTSPFAAPTRFGMGDYFIYDLFESVNATLDTQLGVRHQGTFYWHEKAA